MTAHTLEQRKNFFSRFFESISPFNKTKTHDFRKYQEGIDYDVDFADSYTSAQMITVINVGAGEHIILTDREHTLKYCAEIVDYYWNSNSLREIRLKPVF